MLTTKVLPVHLYYSFLSPLVIFSWRGAVIDTDKATESIKDGEKEDSHAKQEVKLSKEPGICCVNYEFAFLIFHFNTIKTNASQFQRGLTMFESNHHI